MATAREPDGTPAGPVPGPWETLLVGEDLPLPSRAGPAVARIRSAALTHQRCLRNRRIILGDEALREHDPSALSQLSRHWNACVVLCPGSIPVGRLAEWLRYGFTEVVTREELPEQLLGGTPPAIRRPESFREWLPEAGDVPPDLARALALVPQLTRPFSVELWSERLGWTRLTLWRRVRCRATSQNRVKATPSLTT